MFEERKLKNKTLQLYSILSHSDFKGNYEDGYTIERLFALLCLDLTVNKLTPGKYKANELLDLATEVIRIVETSDNMISNYSIMNWCRALNRYMMLTGKKYKEIHSMSTYDLKHDVKQHLETEDSE